MAKKTVRDADLKGKRVLCRVDFNVPIKGGKIGDDTRIRESLPTLRYILEQPGDPAHPDEPPGPAEGQAGTGIQPQAGGPEAGGAPGQARGDGR